MIIADERYEDIMGMKWNENVCRYCRQLNDKRNKHKRINLFYLVDETKVGHQ